MSGQQHAPAVIYSRERNGTHFTRDWVGPRAGLDGRKISSPPGFDLGNVQPGRSVAIPTELPGSQSQRVGIVLICVTVKIFLPYRRAHPAVSKMKSQLRSTTELYIMELLIRKLNSGLVHALPSYACRWNTPANGHIQMLSSS